MRVYIYLCIVFILISLIQRLFGEKPKFDIFLLFLSKAATAPEYTAEARVVVGKSVYRSAVMYLLI